jgi:hypothetical protein
MAVLSASVSTAILTKKENNNSRKSLQADRKKANIQSQSRLNGILFSPGKPV